MPDPTSSPVKGRFMRYLKVIFWSAFAIGAIVLGRHGYALHAREQARDSDRDDMKAIAKALTSYREKHGRFPPPVLYNPATDTPFSWRVALLPELGLQDLYDQYRQNEPWDSEHNREVLARIPDVYRSATASGESTSTAYFALTGDGTAFGTSDGLSEPHLTDSLASTITIVSALRDIPWTSPRDIEFDQYEKLPELGGLHDRIFHAALADGSVRGIAQSIDSEILRHLILACDGWPHECEF